MTASLASRRGFLRSLTTLPLVGGSVALIGAPSAVAVPVSVPLLEAYRDFLVVEYGETLIELAPLTHPQRLTHPHMMAHAQAWRREWCQDVLASRDPARFAKPPATPPSTRAALVLSAVGHGWEARI